MKHFSLKNLFALLVAALFSFMAAAQDMKLYLKSGTVETEANLSRFISSPEPSDVFNGQYYRLIQFNSIPTAEQRSALEQTGLKLLHYLPRNAYFASVPAGYDRTQLINHNIYSVSEVKPAWKLTPNLLQGDYPAWAIPSQGQLELIINYYPGIPVEKVKEGLAQNKMVFVKVYEFSNRITVRINDSQLLQLAALPFVSYIEPVDPPSEPENQVGRTSHRSNFIATDYASGRHYDGTGVNVAMGDDGVIGPHIDYQGRVDQSNVSSNDGNHGDHVAGTIMGAGNINPLARGMAYGADLYVYDVWDAVDMTPATYISPGIRITSTSYSNGCNAGYTTFAQTVDQQSRQMPSLLHVFSAGNSGTSDCGYGAGAGWGNVTGGVKIGKNVIAVANLDYQDGLANSSSRGPAHDGRIKPDISAVGTSVYSTIDVNTYANMSGTSMACPGTSGTLAQLYHAYKTVNSGNDPEGGLMKSILMNSADDLGNAGPDFKFGYGRINAARAVRTVEDGRHLTSSINQGGVNTHTITVPAGTQQLRVMIYWTDYEAAANASVALVNDLDMQVSDPSSTTYDPWVLDHTPNPTNLNAPATRGVDNLNNVEQVTIDNPASGTYTVTVNGFAVPQGPQSYFITYELIDDAVTLTYPIGGEGFVPGETETLRWDAYGTSGTFDIEYSLDSAVTWSPMATGLSGGARSYNWVIPGAVVSGQCLVRITRGTSSDMSDAPFSIIGLPLGLNISWACPDSLQLTWNNVTGATGYEISMLGAKYMDSIGVSSTNSFVVHNVIPTLEYWFSVKALGPLNAEGRRMNAVQKTPGTFNCPVPFDASVNAVTNPQPATWYDCHNYSSIPVSISIKNEGTASLSNVPVYYSINNGTPVQEVFAGPLAPGNTAVYTFTSTANLSAPASYSIVTWSDQSGDGNLYNDSSQVEVRVIAGSPVSLPWSEGFESFTLCSTANDCELVNCSMSNGSINEVNGSGDDIDWRTTEGATPSTGTGPAVDHTIGTSAGNYIYLEPSGGCDMKEAQFVTPCIDLTTAMVPQLDFWYHMTGADMGTLHVDINSNGSWTNDVMPAISGEQGNSWQQGSVDLSTFAGEIVNVRFRGVTGNGFAGDMALDDISVTETTGMNDLAFSSNFSLYPNPGTGLFNLAVTGQGHEMLEISITDVQGRVIMKQDVNGSKGANILLDLSKQAAGIYFLQIHNESGQFYTRISKM